VDSCVKSRIVNSALHFMPSIDGQDARFYPNSSRQPN
jgi:hypothetical protein